MSTKSERTRQFIIEKAAPLFNTKGYYGTSMGDILAATGLAKGGVYGNFASKEDIALEAFEFAFQTVIEALNVRIRAEHHALDKLKAILDYYSAYHDTPSVQGGCPLLNTGCDSDDSDLPRLRARVKQATQQMLRALVHIIEKGKEYGQVRSEVDAEVMADLVFSQIEGGLVLAKLTGDGVRLQRVLSYTYQMLLRELPH
ncbi:DNA-binding transcriptional regulator, AcrR family [Catalinimonas alkaloidigena]|uniref:DNA-binding transcriptional regulator, AcrR family n=1 Tax=Catalinimonas alkaloidigena TaxID=1075417 RepID=A0A1G8XPC3_9BACT|nr:TetR/AcrR family transcriptional regulator [Catalinimonas alkaloidigena]SDJ92327.1 DNA-binding transcriptional regulator, AcrR family [Catalinimonas alkaloidigena]